MAFVMQEAHMLTCRRCRTKGSHCGEAHFRGGGSRPGAEGKRFVRGGGLLEPLFQTPPPFRAHVTGTPHGPTGTPDGLTEEGGRGEGGRGFLRHHNTYIWLKLIPTMH